MKELNGRELADFVKERQAHQVRVLRSKKIFPKLLIIRDSDNPVITKYVNLKVHYGEDIGIDVDDVKVSSIEEAQKVVRGANDDKTISGMIVQLPLLDKERTDEVVNLISPEKDVDGLSQVAKDSERIFESATATAITRTIATMLKIFFFIFVSPLF